MKVCGFLHAWPLKTGWAHKMKLTETLIRKIIREELLREMAGQDENWHYDNLMGIDSDVGIPAAAWSTADTLTKWYLDYMAGEMSGDADSVKNAMMGAEMAWDEHGGNEMPEDHPQDDHYLPDMPQREF